MQDEALDCLIELDHYDGWAEILRERHEPAGASELTFGRVIARDFATGMVLDRLTLYERRIEHSLCRMMNELRLSKKQGVASGTDSLVGAGFKPALPASGETPDSVTTNGTDSVKQSQLSCRTDGGHSPPYASQADSAKQSQPVEDRLCETKPTEAAGAVCRVPARACPERAEGAYPVAQPPSAGNTAGGGGAPCVATSQADSAKQTQPAKPAKGFVMVQPRARYAWHYHSPGR